jgi:hypothetical protein
VGKSDISEFEKAVGQFIVYRFAMRKREPERQLFLVVELGIYENFFVNPEVLELIETEDLKVMVFDKLKEVIVRWIN